MGQFDFLNEPDEPPEVYEPEWQHEPIENWDAGITDAKGRRIGFQITRCVRIVEGNSPVHARWVSVTKDGEWIRNDNTAYFSTREAAEAWVIGRINESLARYRRLEQKRNTFTPDEFDFSRPTSRSRRRPAKRKKTFMESLDDTSSSLDKAGKSLQSCGCALVMLGLLLLSPFLLAMLL
jgi:hypothetical protein